MAAVSGLTDYRQKRLSLKAGFDPSVPAGSCGEIWVKSTVVEQGKQSGKPYRFESTESYRLQLRDGAWVAVRRRPRSGDRTDPRSPAGVPGCLNRPRFKDSRAVQVLTAGALLPIIRRHRLITLRGIAHEHACRIQGICRQRAMPSILRSGSSSGAFGKIVDSIVGDLIMPVVGAMIGSLDFSTYSSSSARTPTT